MMPLTFAPVGEENIIILDYVENDMQFTPYVKQKTNGKN